MTAAKKGARTSRPATGQSTGELVYSCAVDLISERGFHGTSLRDVATAVGVQMSTLYYYYPSKQDLLVTIMTTAMERMTERVTSAASGGSSASARLRAAVHAHILFHADHGKEALIADIELRALEADGRAQIVSLRDRYEAIFRAIIEDGQRSGEFRDFNPRIATRALLGAITDVAYWFRPGGGLSLEEISALYWGVFTGGLAEPSPHDAPIF